MVGGEAARGREDYRVVCGEEREDEGDHKGAEVGWAAATERATC